MCTDNSPPSELLVEAQELCVSIADHSVTLPLVSECYIYISVYHSVHNVLWATLYHNGGVSLKTVCVFVCVD